ncbi:HAD-IA family hydrolase [Streptomyces sp. B8F3]|uniref:HAD-IA family hydrolase n=1 Tax=unclassified Streptomyces TaxID=2593676 RepID=UPI00325D4EE1
MPTPLPARPRLITFDTYGTLIDWDGALRAHLRALFADRARDVDVAAFYRRWYYGYALPAVHGRFLPYRELLATTMAEALDAEARITADPAELAALGDVMAEADPFADSAEILRLLGTHAPLATISNSQRDIIDVSVRKLGDPFTYVFTGEAVGAYKPHRALFELVLGRAGVEPHEAVHVAQSQYVDLPRSVPMGIPTVWINRQGQELRPTTPAPTAQLPDLRGLPQLLGLAEAAR